MKARFNMSDFVKERNEAYEWLIEHDMSPVIK